MKTKPLQTLSTNFALSQLGSLIYAILDTKLGIAAALTAAGVSVPVLIASIGAFLGLEGWKAWKEAETDDEKLKILEKALSSEITEKQKALEKEFAVKEFDNEQDHQRFVQLIRMLRQSIVEIRQAQKETKLSVDEVRRVLQNHIETHGQLRKLLPVNNLPYLSMGDLFKGRETVLADLRRQQDTTVTTAITQRMTMTGLGGIGKTRLAVEFAWEGFTRGIFRDVFFVRCGQDEKTAESKERTGKKEQQDHAGMERLQAAVAVLAGPALLAVDRYEQQKTDVLFAGVLDELRQRDKWLLIFDNADDIEMRKAILSLLPVLNRGRVMVTSRLADWGDGVKKIELKKLEKGPSRDYLLQKTDSSRVKSENDKSLAEDLAVLLDGLPVALEQAAAYICRMKIGFTRHLEEYRKNQKDALAWEKKNKLPEDYPRPVLTTWQMTEQRLTEAERAMLYLAAFLAPDDIPVKLSDEWPGLVGKAAAMVRDGQVEKTADDSGYGGIDIRDALAGLADWSMAEFDGESFSVHRLVQETTRLRMNSNQQKRVCEIVLGMLQDADPWNTVQIQPDDVQSWWYWKRMEGHIAAAVGYADNLQIKQPASVLMNNLGLYYNAQARYAQAEPLYKRALEIDEASLGKDHPKVTTDLNNLAVLYQDTNRLSEAEPLMKQALAIDEASLGKDHPNMAIDLNNLAQLYKATNRLSDAEPLMKRALAIDEAGLGKDHPNVAIRLNNLAMLYQATNRLSQAEPLMKRAMEIDETSFGKDHPNVAIDLNNLTMLYQATNRLSEAEPMMKRALAIFENSLGTEHPSTITVRNNLAELHLKR